MVLSGVDVRVDLRCWLVGEACLKRITGIKRQVRTGKNCPSWGFHDGIAISKVGLHGSYQNCHDDRSSNISTASSFAQQVRLYFVKTSAAARYGIAVAVIRTDQSVHLFGHLSSSNFTI